MNLWNRRRSECNVRRVLMMRTTRGVGPNFRISFLHRKTLSSESLNWHRCRHRGLPSLCCCWESSPRSSSAGIRVFEGRANPIAPVWGRCVSRATVLPLKGRWYPTSHTTLGPFETWDPKLKSASRAFTLGVKAAIEKNNFSICPKY